MKNVFLLFGLFNFIFISSFSQINTFPYTEDFEGTFTEGYNVNFLPNWWGNYVVYDTIYQDDSRPYSGSYNLTMIPQEEELLTIIEASLDLSDQDMMVMEMWVASDTNGNGDKSSRLYAQLSVDGGINWYPRVEMGGMGSFPNAVTLYSKYYYAFHPGAANKENVKCRIIGRTGEHPGTAAKLLIDEVTFYEVTQDSFPPLVLEPKIIDAEHIQIRFSEPVAASAEEVNNYVFSNDQTVISASLSAGMDTVNLVISPPLEEGIYHYLTLSGIQDTEGNLMEDVELELLYNTLKEGLVISEIMYDEPPVGENDDLEFIEIYNATCETIQLGGLKIKDAIYSHHLAPYALGPGEYFLMAKNNAVFQSVFGFPANIQWRAGNLANEGNDFIAFYPAGHSSGTLLDSIVYQITDPWPEEGAGTGASIEICNKFLDNSIGSNWQASTAYAGTYLGYSIYATPGQGCDASLNPVLDLGEDVVFCGITSSTLDAANPGSKYLWSTGDTTQSINIIESGEYSVIVNNGFGAAFDTINVAFEPSFTASWDVPEEPLCPNTDILFSDLSEGATDWYWDFGDGEFSTEQNPIHQYTNDGVYTISLVLNNASLCADSLSTTIEVSQIEAGMYIEDEIICVSESVLFNNTSQGAVAWHWDFGDATFSDLENPVHSYSMEGEMLVTLIATNSLDCSDTASLEINVELCTGIGEYTDFIDLQVYPNPADGNFKISLISLSVSNLTIEIFDLNGKILYGDLIKESNEWTKEFNVADFAKGVFLVKVSSEENVAWRKLIIN